MSWMMPILSAILVSLGLGTGLGQPKAEDKCEPTPVATVEQLGDMLVDLGCAPVQNLRSDGTISGFKVELVSWDYAVPLSFQISQDGKSVAITAVLSSFGDIEGALADNLATFLQLNSRTDNPHVYGINERSMLTVQITVPLAGLNKESLDEVLWNLDGELMTTEDLWYVYCPVPVEHGNGGPIGSS